MSYPSVDQLQNVLTEEVFHYAKDSKKAAGRALGTLVEIITFYSLKAWGLERNVAIEKPLPEFGNDDITHNVEYSLHPYYFKLKASTIEGWFSVIAPRGKSLAILKDELGTLKGKNWQEIHV